MTVIPLTYDQIASMIVFRKQRASRLS